MSDAPAKTARGRPPLTSRGDVERVALEMFTRRGFEETTMDSIASAVGVGRRTLFRYFPSKNDIVWGDFDQVLDRLRDELGRQSPELRLTDALARGVVASNHYPDDLLPELRQRLTLITTVPALQAHSMLRYADWRGVIADWVARRRGEDATNLIPQTIAHAALGASIAAFSVWVHDGGDLEANLRAAYAGLSAGFDTEEDRGPAAGSPRRTRPITSGGPHSVSLGGAG